MRIEPRLKYYKEGQRLTLNSVNSIIRRIEYGAGLLNGLKLIAGEGITLEGGKIKAPEPEPAVTPVGWMVSKLLVSGNANLPYEPVLLPGRPSTSSIAYRVPFGIAPYGITYNLTDIDTPDVTKRYGPGIFNPPDNPFLYPGIGGLLSGISVDKGFNLKINSNLSVNGPKIINLLHWKNFLAEYVPNYFSSIVPPNSFSGSGYKAYWSSSADAFHFFGVYVVTSGSDTEYGIGELMA